MELKDTRVDLEKLLKDLELIMHVNDVKQVKHFINYDELKLAVETLCEYLSEDEISLNNAIVKQTNELCETLKIDKIYWIDFDDGAD